jgi:glutamyl/glutaminyl-tRNA synthetase
VTHTSDWFPEIQGYMEKMLDLGACYADNGSAEEMKEQRDTGTESTHREARTPAENRKIFAGMLAGEEAVLKAGWCIRAKWDMKNKFKCLRDPVMYRCKNETHHRHGDKYKAYPTYDFACPIVDSLEGITHAMRTIEYHDRNDGYYLVQKTLGLRPCVIYDYSRLNLVSTILSKRSLKWFVDEAKVEGWTDPRFPTVQGIMRRCMSVAALTKFMLE